MVWSKETSCGYESAKIAPHVVQYTRGRCLDLGCGMHRVWPSVVGIDNGAAFGGQTAAQIKGEIDDLSLFADASHDGVFSSHALEDFPRDKVPGVLREWARVLKIGGYLSLYVPSMNLYPKCGEDGANPAHKWDIYPGDVEKILRNATSCGWTQVESEERSMLDEYSLFLVFQKRDDGQWVERSWCRNPGGKKRALVIRYGAIGDQMMAASILPGLKKLGYHVTYNTTEDAQSLLLHDPHIDEWLLQDKDQVPNTAASPELGAYWEKLRERYDYIVNLSESIEGALLAMPGRPNHSWPDAARRKLLNRNYLEWTHDTADVPRVYNQRFYATPDEIAQALAFKAEMGKPVVSWALVGSAAHKTYPWIEVVCAWLLKNSPCHIVLTGDSKVGKLLQDSIVEKLKAADLDVSRVHGMCGEWRIRQALAFAQIANCVVGPETGVLNAVAMEKVPKVIYLSHSSRENLTKHWNNTTTLFPDRAKAPCYPCHRMHYDWTYCPKDEATGAATCAASISAETVFKAIAAAMGAAKKEFTVKRSARAQDQPSVAGAP